MFIVGLTGGIATGKSTVLKIFQVEGIPVIDADQIAREIVEPDKPAWRLLVKEFGEEILSEDRTINRNALASLVFNDRLKRRKLNSITHPRIQYALMKVALVNFLKGHAFIVMELPLLFETERMMTFIHKIITVICDDHQQLDRLMSRNSYSAEIAKQRIVVQMPLDVKVAKSHFVIYNNYTFEATQLQTESIINLLKESNFHWYIRGGIIFFSAAIYMVISYGYQFLFH